MQELEESKKVVEKIESGAYTNLPQLKYTEPKSKKNNKSTKNPASETLKEDIKEIVKESNHALNADATDAPKPEAKPEAPEVKATPEPKVPPQPKVASFPVKAHVNIYGFIGLGKDELRALGLTVINTPKAKNKLSADVPIELTSYDSTAKVLTVKILG